MDDYLEQRIRVLELEVEELKEQAKQTKPSQEYTWIWAFVPILALMIPVLALVGDIF